MKTYCRYYIIRVEYLQVIMRRTIPNSMHIIEGVLSIISLYYYLLIQCLK